MTNLEKLKEISNEADLIKWLELFAIWFDPGGWCDDSVVEMFLNEEYEGDDEDEN